MRSFILLLSSVAVLHAQQGKPGELLTARYGAGGTWNLYMPSEKPLTWSKAQTLASEKSDPLGGSGKKGHLATIASSAENAFVYHYILGRTIWIGLTDSEQFPGAKEAGGAQDRGWAWVNGEPVAWTNWQSSEPTDDNRINDKGEDGVAIEHSGYWNDRPTGAEGQPEQIFPFMVEWDVQSPEPVPGARVVGAMLPPKWPGIDSPPKDDGKSPWLCLHTARLPVDPRLEDLAKLLLDGWQGADRFRLADINFGMAMKPPPTCFGWIFSPPADYPGSVSNGFGLLARARLVIPKAGIYTFNVHADDGFAMRVGNQKWKAAFGDGGIDPTDATTFSAFLLNSDNSARGVIELPAGETPIEVFFINGTSSGLLQIMTAEGEHPLDGSTDRWRLLGHRAGGKVAWPGVSAAGWKVTVPQPGEDRKVTADKAVLDALLRVEDGAAKVATGLAAINFHDPECSRAGRFPGRVPFPDDPPSAQDDRVVMAEAELVIPQDGLYHIGVAGDDLCSIQIVGRNWERIVRDASVIYARLDGDSISCRFCDNGVSQECIGEIKLVRGNYPIRVVSWDRNGTSAMNVFAAPAGWAPRLLTKEKAGIEEDIPGLSVLSFEP